jgi:hypothetical protein
MYASRKRVNSDDNISLTKRYRVKPKNIKKKQSTFANDLLGALPGVYSSCSSPCDSQEECTLNKHISDKHISDKHISDKHISDKHISDKHISDKISYTKAEVTALLNKQEQTFRILLDEKLKEQFNVFNQLYINNVFKEYNSVDLSYIN